MVRNRLGSVILATILAIVSFASFTIPASAQTKINGIDPFPKKLKKSGSYLQTSNVMVKNTSDTAVLITASNVTLDLQGFTIAGPGSGTGVGIDASGFSNVTIENGIITGMGGAGMKLGPNCIVRNVQVLSNGGDGIDCGPSCLVSNSVISSNLGAGLNFTDATSGYVSDVLSGNGSTITNGTNLGANVCNGSTCP
jgi:hypothetical protein